MSSAAAAGLRDDPEALAAFREAMKHQGERPNLVDNVNEVAFGRPDGNSRAYSISRVQRECDPDTVAAVRVPPPRRWPCIPATVADAFCRRCA